MNVILKTLAFVGLTLIANHFYTMIVVIIEDGPVLFVQKRLGKNKKLLLFIKLEL